MGSNYFTPENSWRHLFFITGLTADEFYTDGGLKLNIEQLAHLELKKSGYERIVFYDKDNKLYCYDDDSFALLRVNGNNRKDKNVEVGNNNTLIRQNRGLKRGRHAQVVSSNTGSHSSTNKNKSTLDVVHTSGEKDSNVSLKSGILIKSGEALETACQINTVVLDKTGTITEGRPQVTDVIIQSGSEMQLAEIALALEQSSEHPLANAVVEWVQRKNITAARAEEFCAEPGKGVCGYINKEKYFAGNQAYLQEQGINTAAQESLLEELAQAGKTPLIFADARAVLGIIAIADREKESSIRAISKLKGLGLEVVMLTGDNQITAEAVAKRVGVDRCIAGVLPGDKAAVIREIQAQNKKVAMAGDGINDAPALMCANLGIAIGAGTDIAIDSADAVLMKNDLQDVVSMIELSRSTLLNIKENLFWAFIYNVIGIPLAAGVLYPAMGIKLSPMIGAAAMSLSSVCVVMNALRLKRFKADCSSDDFSAGDSKEKPAEIEAIKRKDVEKMEKIIKIEGMMCQHCQKHAHDALAAMDGVTDVVVDLENKQATVQCTREISIDEFAKVLADAGYVVVK